MSENDEDDVVQVELDHTERREVIERRSGSAKVIHEVIRQAGEAELKRSSASLIASGLMAGVLICFSPICEALILRDLPAGEKWTEMVGALGYTVGFVIVILGNMQLFTESTVTAVLPIATRRLTARSIASLLRLWALVFAANLLGTFAVAVSAWYGALLSPDHLAGVVDLGRAMDAHGFARLVVLGVPSGLLIGAVAWIQPNARGSEFWIVVIATWAIAAGGFSHCVAGSFDAWMLWLAGQAGWLHAVGAMILPSLLGNIAGGTFLFAFLAHAQVRDELI